MASLTLLSPQEQQGFLIQSPTVFIVGCQPLLNLLSQRFARVVSRDARCADGDQTIFEGKQIA